MRISTRSWPACVCTSEAYLACCGPMCEMWSILSLMPVSFVKRWPISASFLSELGAQGPVAELARQVRGDGGLDLGERLRPPLRDLAVDGIALDEAGGGLGRRRALALLRHALAPDVVEARVAQQ